MIPPVDRRVFLAIAFGCLIAAFLAQPYSEALIAAGPLAHRAGGPLARLAFVLALTLIGTLPMAYAGLALGRPLGLGAPLLAAWFAGEPVGARARAALARAGATGLALGAALLWILTAFRTAFDQRLPGPIPAPPPAWAGVLGAFSAGITEETILRLFLLTAVLAVLVRVLPAGPAAWTANGIAAVVFGALHFGNVRALGMRFDLLVVTGVLGFNGVAGIVFGRTYLKHGIEAAMAAHTACDLVLHGLGPVLSGGR